VKFIHRFYTLDSPTPCVAGYDLVCAAKLVIDPARHMVWSWHVDLYATPSSRTLPSLRTMSADEPSTASVSAADKWLNDSCSMLDVQSFAVEPRSTESLQRPYVCKRNIVGYSSGVG